MAKDLTSRMVGAAFLDIGTYEEVEHDQDATGQAAAVVALVALCQAIGAWQLGPFSAVGAAASALVAWLVWAGITFAVGTKVFGGEATWGELLRTLGFAQAPGVLFAFAIIPLLGWIPAAAASVWVLITGFVAIRQALDIGNGKTFLTILVGWIVAATLKTFLFFL